MADDYRPKLKAFAERMVGLAPHCTNEESTKLFLILPFLNFLGYDVQNPNEVRPEYSADFAEKYKGRVDFVILNNGEPVIAIECKALGSALRDDRGQLRGYFNAVLTVRMGVITDGLVYEFYADSVNEHIMDQNAFLTLDMREFAKGKIEDSVEEGIRSLQKANFNPDNIGAEAERKLIFQKFVQEIATLAENPSETFVHMLLRSAGRSHVRTKSRTEFRELTVSAFSEFVNLRILQRLDLPSKEKESEKQPANIEDASGEKLVKSDEGLTASPLECEVVNYIKRRLAFLVEDDRLFNDIDFIDQRKYKGKFVVFYKKANLGRLFDFFEGGAKKYRFDFGQAGGEISTDKLIDIDKVLLTVFTKRVEEIDLQDK
jgi:hypothetical protein